MNRFTIQGISDERDSCDCCGKSNLKRTVALADADDGGEVVFFGTTCAARAMKIPAAEVRKGARDVQRAKDSAAAAARDAAARVEREAWFAFLLEKTGKTSVAEGILAMGGITTARAAFKSQATHDV